MVFLFGVKIKVRIEKLKYYSIVLGQKSFSKIMKRILFVEQW